MLLCVFALWISLQVNGAIIDPVYDELEGLPLIEALIADQKLDLAQLELARFNRPTSAYWRALGNFNMAREKWDLALAHYSQMNPGPERELLMARSHFRLKKYDACRDNYQNSNNLWQSFVGDALQKAGCEQHSSDPRSAWDTLYQAKKIWGSPQVRQEMTALALNFGLSRAGLALVLEGATTATVGEFLNLAELFHHKKMAKEALMILELGRLRFPLDLDLNLTLAKLYFDQNMNLATADAFERATLVNLKYAFQTSELHRQQERKERTKYFSQMISTETEKLKSELAQDIQARRYPKIAAMEPLLLRSTLASDAETNYAMAYALAIQGEQKRSLKFLTRINNSNIYDKSIRLKKMILDQFEKETLPHLIQ